MVLPTEAVAGLAEPVDDEVVAKVGVVGVGDSRSGSDRRKRRRVEVVSMSQRSTSFSPDAAKMEEGNLGELASR
jgi:hypothetical protein